MSDGPTLLLLGASGFLGGHLRAAATGSGFRVLTAGRQPGELPACDLLDPAALEACIGAATPDLIVNAAGDSSVARSWEQPLDSFAVNATGVRNLLEATVRSAAGAHVTCLSSAAVYGEPDPRAMPLAESAPTAPVSPYGEAKLAMEGFCAEYARSRGLAVAVVRAFNLVGPGQPPFSAAAGMARQIAAAERAGEEEIELALGNPGAARDSTDVRDAARLILALSQRRARGHLQPLLGQRPQRRRARRGAGGADAAAGEHASRPGSGPPLGPAAAARRPGAAANRARPGAVDSPGHEPRRHARLVASRARCRLTGPSLASERRAVPLARMS